MQVPLLVPAIYMKVLCSLERSVLIWRYSYIGRQRASGFTKSWHCRSTSGPRHYRLVDSSLSFSSFYHNEASYKKPLLAKTTMARFYFKHFPNVSNMARIDAHRCFHLTSSYQHNEFSDPENIGEPQKGVNFDTLGTWNNRLALPISVEQSIKRGKLIPKISLEKIGSASLIGRRRVNEDRYVVCELSPSILCFAIFDGHSGSAAADYASLNIQEHLTFWLQRSSDLHHVLEQAFTDINNMFARHLQYYHLGSENSNAGTTATVCLLRNNIQLVVGHVGDSHAILCREGKAIRLTPDHHPENQDEVERLKKFGGYIICDSLGRAMVNGRLSMTRSIGDMELKPFGVISTPYVRSLEVKHSKDAFLVMTTDGLNFVMNDQEIVDVIANCENPEEAAGFIVDQALQFASEDNVTALVIPFAAWGKYKNTRQSIPYSFRSSTRG